MKRFFLYLIGLLMSVNALAIPAKTNKLVNDYAGILTSNEVATLERYLEAYSDSTSNQICVVTVKTLNGQSISMYAQELGQAWGVGQKGKDNGVIILIKPKYGNERGEVFIATGYGVEGNLPDALCKRIVETKMIPQLKKNNYYGAICSAVDEVQKAIKGESTIKQNKEVKWSDLSIGGKSLVIVILIILLFIVICATCTTSSGGGWSSGGSSSSSFGGFGGGSFGGGGAGGSW